MIAVFTSQGFQRFVTARQAAAEVAGKVLPKVENLWRRAEKIIDPVFGEVWFANYFKPKPELVEVWANRPQGVSDGAPIKRTQIDIAH